jgi:hypothetical protein
MLWPTLKARAGRSSYPPRQRFYERACQEKTFPLAGGQFPFPRQPAPGIALATRRWMNAPKRERTLTVFCSPADINRSSFPACSRFTCLRHSIATTSVRSLESFSSSDPLLSFDANHGSIRAFSATALSGQCEGAYSGSWYSTHPSFGTSSDLMLSLDLCSGNSDLQSFALFHVSVSGRLRLFCLIYFFRIELFPFLPN